MKVYLVTEDIAIGLRDIIEHKIYKYKLDALNHLRLFKEREVIKKYKQECLIDSNLVEESEFTKYLIFHDYAYCDSHYYCYIEELELEE